MATRSLAANRAVGRIRDGIDTSSSAKERPASVREVGDRRRQQPGVGGTSRTGGLDGVLGTAPAVAHLAQRGRTTHEGDVAVPELEQVLCRQAPAGDVVDGDRRERAAVGEPVEEHDRDVQAGQPLEGERVLAAGGDEHPAHPRLLEQLEVPPLTPRVARAVAEQDHAAGGVDLVLHAARDVGEERVGGVDDDQADRPATTGSQLAGGLVADEAQPVDHRLDALERLGSDRLRPVEHVRHGAHGDACGVRHVLDADPLTHCAPPHPTWTRDVVRAPRHHAPDTREPFQRHPGR